MVLSPAMLPGAGLLPSTAQWLKRQMLDEDAFAAQHGIEAVGKDGVTLNLAESPAGAARGHRAARARPSSSRIR